MLKGGSSFSGLIARLSGEILILLSSANIIIKASYQRRNACTIPVKGPILDS